MSTFRSYRLLTTWQLEAVIVPMLVLMPVQFLLSGLLAIGLGFIAPEIDAQTARYLATGAPTVSILLVGMVVLPQQQSNEKASGADAFYRTLPASAPVRLAAQLTPHLITALPGALLALVVAAWHFDFPLHPSPLALAAFMTIALTGAAIGNVIAVISPHPIVTTVITNIALFFVMLFSPINFPIERLPGWLQAAHEVLPVAPMAELARSTLVGTATSVTDWLHVGAWAIGSFIASAAASARRR